MSQGFALVGAALVLGAFGGLQLGRLAPGDVVYQAGNMVGGALLCTSALMTQTWGFVALNVVWATFAAFKLAEILRARGRRRAP